MIKIGNDRCGTPDRDALFGLVALAIEEVEDAGEMVVVRARTRGGVQRVLKRDRVAALVIGDVADPGKEPVPLAKKLWDDIENETGLRLVELVEDDRPYAQQRQPGLGRHQGPGDEAGLVRWR